MLVKASLTVEDYEFLQSKASPRAQRFGSVVWQLAMVALFLAIISPALWRFLSVSGQSVSGSGTAIVQKPVVVLLILGGFALVALVVKMTLEMLRGAASVPVPGAQQEVIKQWLTQDGKLGTHIYSLQSQGVRIVSAQDSAWYDWSLFSSCIETARTIRLQFDARSYILVPKSAIAADAIAGTVAQINMRIAGNDQVPRRAARLAEQDSVRFDLTGEISRRDLMEKTTWQHCASLTPGRRWFAKAYSNPIVVLLSAYFCGLSGLYWLIDTGTDLWMEDLEFAELGMRGLFGAMFAAALVFGSLHNLLQMVRRLSGLPLGLQLGLRDLKWGPCRIQVTDACLRLIFARSEQKYIWSSFTSLEETRTLFILRNTQAKTFLVPKRLFSGKAAQDDFRAYAKGKLAK